MSTEDINNLLNQIIDNSKFKSISEEQRETFKKKLVKKYLNDFNEAAFEMMDSEQKKEFSKILATQNQTDIENYIIDKEIDFNLITEIASKKFINEVYLLIKN